MTNDDHDNASPNSILNFEEYKISIFCQVCLMSISLYEHGMESSEEVTKSIVQRVCYGNDRLSFRLIIQVSYHSFILLLNSFAHNLFT